MAADKRQEARTTEREARDLDDVAEIDRELADRPDLAATARAVARELREESKYLNREGEGKDADAGG